MATFLLKKSYLLNSLKEVPFKDLWGSRGVFTTMRMVGKPPAFLLYKPHINNLIISAKKYGIKNNNLKTSVDENNFGKKDFNAADDGIEIVSSNTKINKEGHVKKVKNQINEENEINEPTTSNSITIDRIQDNWVNFIDRLHIKKPSVASIFDNSVPVNLENGKITIKIASSLEFHLNMIEKNYELVKNILNDEFKIELDFVIEKKLESYSNDDQKEDSIDGFKTQNDDQLRDKIVDLFDGEILT